MDDMHTINTNQFANWVFVTVLDSNNDKCYINNNYN